MKLLLPIFINILLVIIFYLANKKTSFQKLSYIKKQIIIGVLFGGLSCFASSFGFDVFGTVANVRDAAPLSAGLIFGAPSGMIAGLIGGLYRWFSVYWGAGYETRLACAIATVLAGILAAVLRKYMFDNKKPTWSYAIVITIFCEVIHMLLIFITNMSNSVRAFELVQSFTIPMIIGNVFAVGCALIAISLISKEGIRRPKSGEQIAETFQRWLLVCIVIAFLVTSTFTYVLQNGMVKIETEEVFTSAISDVVISVKEKSDNHMLSVTQSVKDAYLNDPTNPLVNITSSVEKGYTVAEINIVNKDGIIINSTHPEYIGFDMKGSNQSNEFMILTEGKVTSFVQDYRPMGDDSDIMRKYAGISLEDGGFIQVGYNADQFHAMLDEFVIDVTKNRHVGTGGFVAVCDENMNLVIDDKYSGMHVSTIGIVPEDELERGETATHLYYADIIDGETDFSERYMYVFTFVEGYCIIAAMPEADAVFMRDASLYTSVFMQVIIFAVLFVFIYFLIKRVIINNLRKINSTLGQITDGNLNLTVDVRSNQEFASLSDDINSTVSTLKRYIAEAAARIDKELEYAKQIQLSVLPTNYPNNENYAINAQMIAAKEVGGDFYDFYELDENTIAFLVADVSGKGIPAAMFMMTAKTIIKDLAERRIPVNEILTLANEKLCENNESGMFVTAWMGILDINSGKLQYSNAGHNPPIIKHANGAIEYLKSRAGFVLAGMDGVRYRVNELQLERGDRIFLYTDGVTEATDSYNQLYGEERLLAFMSNNIEFDGTCLLPSLKSDIDKFVGKAPQFDDITMLVLDYKEKEGGVSMTSKIFPAKTDALDDVIGFVEQSLEEFECSMKNSMAICVAIEEVFVNVAHYAYGEGEGDVNFDIGFNSESREVSFVMRDKGIPFDPLKKADPDITLSAEERTIGGLGIFITKKTMDKVTYTYENGENVLTMIKKI